MSPHQKPGLLPAKRILVPIRITLLLALGACATTSPPEGKPRKEMVYAVTVSNQLISFNAGQPANILSRKPLTGLAEKETVAAIDYRVAYGRLYALGSSGRLYQVNTGSGAVQPVGNTPLAVVLAGTEIGFDFNPAVDRIRVVTNRDQSLRLHPDSGTVIDSDPNAPGLQIDGNPAYVAGDVNAGKMPALVAVAYTYNKQDDKLTTNFAIDAAHGTLVTLGTREDRMPAVSPNTGQLFTVGSLGIGAFDRAAFDIADVSGAAFAAISKSGDYASRWYEVNLNSGKATLIGPIGGGESVVGAAIEP